MPVSIPVKSLSMLEIGDHIKWKRILGGYDHHAIVEDVDDDNHAVLVIENGKNDEGTWKVAEKRVRKIREMYKYIYCLLYTSPSPRD